MLLRRLDRSEKLPSHFFAGLLFVSTAVALGAGCTSAQRSVQSPDYISPGFFSPPPGTVPITSVAESRFSHARHSFAWRIRDGKRELIEFGSPIQHIVVIYMENRTPEDLFGASYASPRATGSPTLGEAIDVINPASASPSISPVPLNDTNDPDHDHSGAGFINKANGKWANGLTYVQTPGPGASVPSIATYLTLLDDWAFEPYALQSNEGPSFESHQYAISGQSGGLTDSSITAQGMVDNPKPAVKPHPGYGTCYTASATPTQYVATVNMNGPYPAPAPTVTVAPCNEYPTILDLMASAAPSSPPYDQWQYVAMNTTSIWSAPMAVLHLYNAYNNDPMPSKAIEPFAVDPDAENFVRNVSGQAGQPARPFALLTFLTPCFAESDHPGIGVDNGPQWLAWVLNAIGNSPYWQNTAVIVTWDDWGGFYDNFSPSPWPDHPSHNAYGNAHDPNEWGFRVPLFVISPYVTYRGYVSSVTPISQGAILNFIENTFGLAKNGLGGDDENNHSNDLSDMLNSSTPLPWINLQTRFTPAPNAPSVCPSPSQL